VLSRLPVPTIDAWVAELARAVHDFVRSRPGRRLVGLGLRIPSGADFDDFGSLLAERLADLALGWPRIHVIRGGESPALLSLELER
jgi:hypothetical protein